MTAENVNPIDPALVNGFVGVVGSPSSLRDTCARRLCSAYGQFKDNPNVQVKRGKLCEITFFMRRSVLESPGNGRAWTQVAGVFSGSPSPGDSGPEEVAGSLQGQFFGMSVDEECSRVTLFSDHAGVLKVYHAQRDGFFLFSTSSLALAAVLGTPSPDLLGCTEFLSMGYVQGDRTFYKGIHVFPPASAWVFDGKNQAAPRKLRYWQPLSGYGADQPPLTTQVCVEKALMSLDRHAKALAVTYDRPVCDLTAGFDSRGVVSTLLKADLPFATVCNGFSGSDDVRVSSAIARRLGWHHELNELGHIVGGLTMADISRALRLTDGEIPVSDYVIPMAVHQHHGDRFNLAFNGSGGELFRGRWWEGEFFLKGGQRIVNKGRLVKRLMVPGHDWALLAPELKPQFFKATERAIQALSTENTARSNTAKIDLMYLNSRMGRWHGRYYSSTFQLMPCSTLFLTGELLELMFRLPWYAKYKNYMYRHLLQASHPVLAREPMGENLPATPVSFAHGRAHLGCWLRGAAGKVRTRLAGGQYQQGAQGMDIHGRVLAMIHDAEPLTDVFLSQGLKTGALYDKGAMVEVVRQSCASGFGLASAQLMRMVTLERAFEEACSVMCE
ncbi:hypothetical protein [Desulfoluna spongiiphila]|uniref:asparagine synthase (glutamine-hydrolyzing) n=1 Tax=Desulfoluna spongiiphila TaxID=419481 RepID=A0A1G5BZ90_9BACT|nr:hypothetical protein [Desulfoluna spongiiphila]SCX95387.1 hypothetical protein SAMN05216233_102274 [Desulfoluna spongiiphila]